MAEGRGLRRICRWRDFGAGATTMFGLDAVPLLENATRLEFAGGLSAGAACS